MQAPPSILRCARRTLRGRCPACGEGRVVIRFTGLRRECPACGWILEREPGAITGAMYLVAIFTQLAAVALMALLWLVTDWSTARMIAVGLPILDVVSLLALALAKRLWIAVEYVTDLGSDEARADYERRAFRRPEP